MPVEFGPGFFEPPVSPDIVQGDVAYNAAANVTATLPATATADNLLIAAYFWSSADGTAPTAPSTPAGYTQLYAISPLGSLFSLFYKLSDGSETGLTIGAEGALLLWEVQGVNTVTPITTDFATNSANSTTGIRAPAAGTIAVTPADALVMGVYAYADNDHNGSTSTHQGANDQGDFYMGIRGDTGSGAEDFHIFCSWTEVTDQSTQSVTYDPSNATAEDNFAAIFVINLDAVAEQPTVLELTVQATDAASDTSTNTSPANLSMGLSPGASDTGTNAAPLATALSATDPVSDTSTNVLPQGVFVTLSTVNEDDPVVDESGVLPFAVNITPAALSSTSSTNASPEDIAASLIAIASDSSTNVTPETLQLTLSTINETVELTVQNIVDGIFAHEIDGYRVDDILRILFAVAAGDISQQVNGSYTIFKPLSTQERITGDAAANNGRDVTSIDVTP